MIAPINRQALLDAVAVFDVLAESSTPSAADIAASLGTAADAIEIRAAFGALSDALEPQVLRVPRVDVHNRIEQILWPVHEATIEPIGEGFLRVRGHVIRLERERRPRNAPGLWGRLEHWLGLDGEYVVTGETPESFETISRAEDLFFPREEP